VLVAGPQERSLEFKGIRRSTRARHRGSLEGAMMLARSYGEPRASTTAAERLIASL
jgi:hypothetical protein